MLGRKVIAAYTRGGWPHFTAQVWISKTEYIWINFKTGGAVDAPAMWKVFDSFLECLSKKRKEVDNMQATDLTHEDCTRIEKFFKEEIQPDNPDAQMKFFYADKFDKKDCLFKEKCKNTGR